MAEAKHHQSNFRGWLYKWTNYLKGYQKRWFVLQHGLLSYYRNQAEMAHTCRGTINLAKATIHTEDSTTIVISNGGTQTFHLKAATEVERQKWIMALELAKSEAKKLIDAVTVLDSESDDEEVQQPDKAELTLMLHTLKAKLEDLNTCNDLIARHGLALTKTLSELEATSGSPHEATSHMKAVQERATLFRITSTAMINACNEFYELSQNQGRRWQRTIQHGHEQRQKLEEMVEQLAKTVMSLEKKARMSISGQPIKETENENESERMNLPTENSLQPENHQNDGNNPNSESEPDRKGTTMDSDYTVELIPEADSDENSDTLNFLSDLELEDILSSNETGLMIFIPPTSAVDEPGLCDDISKDTNDKPGLVSSYQVRSRSTSGKKRAGAVIEKDVNDIPGKIKRSCVPSTPIIHKRKADAVLQKKPKRMCPFCDGWHTQLKRHLFRRHAKEEAVAKAKTLPRSEQHRVISTIRKQGIYKINKSLEKEGKVLMRERRQGGSSAVMCLQCNGFYNDESISRHEQKCVALKF